MAQSILITGCSSGGIGYALVQSFQKRGLTIFATARNVSSMAGLEKLPNVHLLTLDVTDPLSIVTAVQKVKDITGKLDYLVNNAGRGHWMPLLDSNIDEAKQIFEVNYWGVLRMIQAFSPILIAAKGTIVNIGSIVAYMHSPYTGIYSSTKAAVHLLGETLRVELSPFSVKVVTVVTGSVDSALHDKMPAPSLPSDSFYAPVADAVKNRAEAKDNIDRWKPEPFADAVVKDVLAGTNGKIWHGNNSWQTRYGHVLLPMSIIDHILMADSGLERLRKA